MRNAELVQPTAGQLSTGPQSFLFNLQVSEPLIDSPKGIYLPHSEGSYSLALVRSAHCRYGAQPIAVHRMEGFLHFLTEAISSCHSKPQVEGIHCPLATLNHENQSQESALVLQSWDMLLEGSALKPESVPCVWVCWGCALLPPAQLLADTILLLLCSLQPLCTEPQMQVKRSQKKYLG